MLTIKNAMGELFAVNIREDLDDEVIWMLRYEWMGDEYILVSIYGGATYIYAPPMSFIATSMNLKIIKQGHKLLGNVLDINIAGSATELYYMPHDFSCDNITKFYYDGYWHEVHHNYIFPVRTICRDTYDYKYTETIVEIKDISMAVRNA